MVVIEGMEKYLVPATGRIMGNDVFYVRGGKSMHCMYMHRSKPSPFDVDGEYSLLECLRYLDEDGEVYTDETKPKGQEQYLNINPQSLMMAI